MAAFGEGSAGRSRRRKDRATTSDGGTDGPRGARKERAPKRALGEVDEVPGGSITGIHERRSGSARYVVEIDGRPSATVSAQVLAELGVRIGSRVDERLANSLRDESSRLAVFDKAVELLAVRARSERDLRLRLRRAGALADAIDRAIERLRSLGLVDDEAYARQLAHARVVGGGVSKRRIGQELQRKGVARDVADEAIGATLEDVALDEFGAAKEVAEKRLRAMRSLDPETRRRRLYGFLARRGYEHSVIARVLKTIGDGATAAGDDDASDDEEGDVE